MVPELVVGRRGLAFEEMNGWWHQSATDYREMGVACGGMGGSIWREMVRRIQELKKGSEGPRVVVHVGFNPKVQGLEHM